MDSANNRDKSTSHLQEKGWNDPTLNWDDMKDGIFEKILEEDPAYFDKKENGVFQVGSFSLALFLYLQL